MTTPELHVVESPPDDAEVLREEVERLKDALRGIHGLASAAGVYAPPGEAYARGVLSSLAAMAEKGLSDV